MRITDRTCIKADLRAAIDMAGQAVSKQSYGNVYVAGDLPNITLRVYDSRGHESRTSPSGRRGKGASWESHRVFLDVLFTLRPMARVQTSLTCYRGAADFNKRHKATYHTKVGSMARPVSFGDL